MHYTTDARQTATEAATLEKQIVQARHELLTCRRPMAAAVAAQVRRLEFQLLSLSLQEVGQ